MAYDFLQVLKVHEYMEYMELIYAYKNKFGYTLSSICYYYYLSIDIY